MEVEKVTVIHAPGVTIVETLLLTKVVMVTANIGTTSSLKESGPVEMVSELK